MWTTIVLLFATASALSVQRESTASAELELTADQYHELSSGKSPYVVVAKIGENQYSGLSPYLDRIIDKKPPVDCWDLYQKFRAANKAKFEAQANKNCRDFTGCWCCPNGGLCISFIVKPTRLCLDWTIAVTSVKIAAFQP